jgi:hypothetical protein
MIGDAAHVELELELELTDPIKGLLRERGKRDRPFDGWLELLSALEAVCTEVRK